MNSIISPVHQIDHVFYYILAISAVILFGITVALITFVIHYRSDRHPIPSTNRGNWVLELIWTIVPTLIALSMFYYGWNAYSSLRTVPAGALEIGVTAQQFSYIFQYPNGKESNELVVPIRKPIKLNLTSADVIHGFYMPAYRVKMDAVPGMKTYAWFFPEKIEDTVALCTQLCGTGHSDMKADIRVISQEDFEKWLAAD